MIESVQMQTDRLILIFVFPLYTVCEETTQERGPVSASVSPMKFLTGFRLILV